MKIVINRAYGGLSLSKAAVLRMRELGSEYARKQVIAGEKYASGSIKQEYSGNFLSDCPRDDKILVAVVEELGEKAADSCELAVVEIPDGVNWRIEEYDGEEWISEVHRIWR